MCSDEEAILGGATHPSGHIGRKSTCLVPVQGSQHQLCVLLYARPVLETLDGKERQFGIVRA